ncbi:rhamnulokinase [Lacticaseibacillus mingshuiensis]|uniref:Rhamnulokinase family protein n=1 Tax=Lacticaseibacillus mingshuiensis TaxID=2799574 RepID=A0ABW4CKW6_9LACO|nr:rhamnulokinase family protein [Lacticaseibacillus mingshuiensis]
MNETTLIAVDLGASSGRVISGQLTKTGLTLKEQFRFSNFPVTTGRDLYWDVLKIAQEIKYGLQLTSQDGLVPESLAVDSWGVDFGYLTSRGELLLQPHSYRDERTAYTAGQLNKKLSRWQQFRLSGNQPSPINTSSQLFADRLRYPEMQPLADRVLMIPGLVTFLLSGKGANEYTIASTGGLLTAGTTSISPEISRALAIPDEWLAPISLGGERLGPLVPEIQREIGYDDRMQVVIGAGHDTAAALLALPSARDEDVAFISCGTWSLIGRQLSKPILTHAAFDAGLTNEGTFSGHTRLLKNLTGLWLIQELQRDWSLAGNMVDFGKMTTLAAASTCTTSFIDPDAPMFASPGHMEAKIRFFLRQTGQALPQTAGDLIRIVLQSLACSYRRTLGALAETTGKPIRRLTMFGGGIQNQLLVQLTADLTGLPIDAGPIEASATGNMISQLMVLQQSAFDRDALLAQIYHPQHILPAVNRDAEYHQFEAIVQNHDGKAISSTFSR